MQKMATNKQKAKIHVLKKQLPEHEHEWWLEYVKPFQSQGRVSLLTYFSAHKLINCLMRDVNVG